MTNSVKAILKSAFLKIPGSIILMFHHVEANPQIVKSGCKLDTEDFYSIINRYHRFATLYDVAEKPSRERIAVTFDDGLADLYTIAYPFLKENNIPFTAFIVPDFLGKPGYITVEQLQELASDPLVTIGAHGTTHRVLTSLASTEKQQEIHDSKVRLERLIGKSVDVFAYSHGQYDKECLEFVNEYRYGLTVLGRPVNFITARKRLELPRINVDSKSIKYAEFILHEVLGGQF